MLLEVSAIIALLHISYMLAQALKVSDFEIRQPLYNIMNYYITLERRCTGTSL